MEQEGAFKTGKHGHSRSQCRPGQQPSVHQSRSTPGSHANGTNTSPGLSQLKARAKVLASARKSLPIMAHEAQIRQSLREKDVLLLVGETGSGKSTQIPHFLVSEKWCTRRTVSYSDGRINGPKPSKCAVGGCIAITEPRRVAAITLARRVAEEMSSLLGSSSPTSKVGYSVRFDNSTSPNMQVKFLTEGMLLQEMVRDPWLTDYSAVVVDEVHERGVNVDLILGFLRQMIARKHEGRGGIPLKIVVMSATADMERLGSYFNEVYAPTGPYSSGRSLGNGDTGELSDLENDESEWSGISASDDEEVLSARDKGNAGNGSPQDAQINRVDTAMKGRRAPPTPKESQVMVDSALKHVTVCHIKGRQHPVTIKFAPEPLQNIVDASLETVFQINYKEPMPGDILVFLTGQETVESLESLIKQHTQELRQDIPKLLALPLFAALPIAAQQQVFEPAPARTRKVIIATNIAETSVTVPGVRHVVDCGKAKIKHFRSNLGLDALLVKPISKSAAAQRAGRAGREGPGQCYRLYTEADFLTMQDSNTPEILRCDLALPILTMKARGMGYVTGFLFLDQPSLQAFVKASEKLYQLGALKDEKEITEIGQQMAKLPLAVPLARVLVAAAEPDLDCVAEVIDIISCLSVDNIFLTLVSEEKKEQAETARRGLYHREGDHLTLLKTVQAYATENSNRKSWAHRHFVSHRAMKQVMQVRKQLQQQCKPLLKKQGNKGEGSRELTSDLAVTILKCFLKGLPTSTARLFPDGSYRTIENRETVAIHPSSVLFGKRVEAIVYNEYVFTNKSYARGVSAVKMEWILEAVEQGPYIDDEGQQG